MANELTYQFQTLLNNGSLGDSFASSSQQSDQTTAKLIRNVEAIGFATHEALDLGGVTTPGFAVFQNLDDTNFVELGVDVAAVFVPFGKLKAGEFALIRLGTAAPYAKADTGSVELFYIIYDD